MNGRKLSALAITLAAFLSGCATVTMLRYWVANRGSETEWRGDAQLTRIPFEMHDNLMIVPLVIDGSEPLPFVLDTGAPYPFLLNGAAIRALDLAIVDRIDFAGFDAQITQGVTLTLGDVSLTGMTAAIMPVDLLPWVETPKGTVAHGILGYEVFRRFVAVLDYRQQTITLHRPESFRYEGERAPIPLIFDDRKPYAWFDVTLPEQEVARVKLHVDTGKTGTLHLDTWSHPKVQAPERGIPVVMQSLKGPTLGTLARLPRLRLGEVVAEDLIVEYRTEDARGKNKKRNGFLGNDVLRRYKVILDYPGKRMWLEKTPDSDLPYVHDMSGLALDDLYDDGYAVKDVVPDSPAARANVRKGDTVTSAQGIPADAYFAHEIRELLRSGAGERVELCLVSANEDDQCVELVLESLL